MFYGERLRQLRELHGLTQTSLCEDLEDVTQYQLSRLEKDQTRPSGDLVTQLAIRFGVTEPFFSRPTTAEFSTQTPQLRARSRLTARARGSAVEWGRLVLSEHRRLEQSANPIHKTPPDLSGLEPTAAGEAARGWLRLSPAGPLDYIVLALERAGVTVLGLPLSDPDLDAYCAWQGDRPLIGLLDGAPGDRQRFSVSHELGHLLLHRDRRDTGKALEDEANAFAAAFLAPNSSLIHDLPHRPTLAALTMVKTKWGVSVKFLIRRCRELGLVDQERATGLYRQMSARGWNKSEPGHVPQEKPRAFRKLCEIAYGQGDVAQRLAADANWSEALARSVLQRHATIDELPFELPKLPTSKERKVVELAARRGANA